MNWDIYLPISDLEKGFCCWVGGRLTKAKEKGRSGVSQRKNGAQSQQKQGNRHWPIKRVDI